MVNECKAAETELAALLGFGWLGVAAEIVAYLFLGEAGWAIVTGGTLLTVSAAMAYVWRWWQLRKREAR